jgi:hypothetical protein
LPSVVVDRHQAIVEIDEQALLQFWPPLPLGYSTSSGSQSPVLLALYSNRGKAGVSSIIGIERFS